MRVRVSYGVDLEELPEISEDLLEGSIEQLKRSIQILERALLDLKESESNFIATVQMIDKARIKIGKSDLTLSDVQTILEGLNNHYNGEKHVPEGRSNMDSSGNSADET